MLAPFFDAEAGALRGLIDRLRPNLTTVLVQPGQTSVDPAALTKLAAGSDVTLEVRGVTRPDDAWIHAKVFVAQTASAALCLQGSANASIAALRRTDPDGNFEMVNLLRGPRDAFNDVFDGLHIGDPVADLGSLDLSYQSSEAHDALDKTGWLLTGAEWTDRTLRISYRGALPKTVHLQVLVRGMLLSAEVVEEGPPLVLEFSAEHQDLLGSADPIRLQLPDGSRSNAVFPCDRTSLSSTLHASVESDERLSRIGDLDLDDDELELLLQELEGTMVLDRRSLWQLAGRTANAGQAHDDDELRLDYSDVDYEMLRGHPKLRQYLRFGGSGPQGRSRLQIVLNAITNSFTDLLEPAQAGAATAAVAAIAAQGDKGLPADDPESEEDDAEAHRRRWSRQARINVLLKNFVQRFGAGLSSTTFQDVAGPEVVTCNYVIFLHLLARIYEREWVDAATLTDAAAATVEAMWGGETGEGYNARLNAEDSATVLASARSTAMHSSSRCSISTRATPGCRIRSSFACAPATPGGACCSEEGCRSTGWSCTTLESCLDRSLPPMARLWQTS